MRKNQVTFGAVGDISFSGHTGEQMLAHGGDWPFAKALPRLRQCELLFGNLESATIPPGFPSNQLDPNGLISKVPGSVGCQALMNAGFDFLNLAANHLLDTGTTGLEYTRRSLQKAGIVTAGAGRTQKEARRLAVIEKNGLTFGFLCYAEESNCNLSRVLNTHAFYTRENVLTDIERHKRDVDVLVVSIHADLEFMPTPSPQRLQNSREFSRAGAKIILEHHPHVPQGIEFAHGALIAYSLGNFVFDAHTSPYMKENGPHTADSFVLVAEVTKKGVQSFERVAFRIGEPPEQRPTPSSGRERRRMLAHFAQLDAWLHDEVFVWKTWRDIARKHFALYLKRAAAQLEAHGADDVIHDIVARLCFTAENRGWMNEILDMAGEYSERLKKLPTPYQRPFSVANQLLAKARQTGGDRRPQKTDRTGAGRPCR